jgi:hypothetical protein
MKARDESPALFPCARGAEFLQEKFFRREHLFIISSSPQLLPEMTQENIFPCIGESFLRLSRITNPRGLHVGGDCRSRRFLYP